MSNPLVSIIMVFLNAENFIREAIDSVFAQTYDKWELMLVDDGSDDGSTGIARKCAEEHPDKVHYLEHKGHRNRCISASRNLGIKKSKGEFIALLDSDDVWMPRKLDQQLAIMESRPDAAMIYGRPLYWNSWTGNAEDACLDYVPELGIEPNVLYEPPRLLLLSYPLGSAGAPCPSDLLLKREVVESVGGFEENFRGAYQLYEDQAFLTKVYLKSPVFVTTQCLTRYRLHENSCDAVVTKAGQYHAVRLFFLKWFRGYLSGQGVKDREVWQALREAEEQYRTQLYPVSSRLSPIIKRVFKKSRLLAANAVSRSLGQEVETWGKAEFSPSYEGHHDTTDCTTISGWAWDANRPAARVQVDIYADGELIARVSSDRYRQDLAAAGKGDGRHAFRYFVPPSLKDGLRHAIKIKISNSDFYLASTPQELECELQIVSDIKTLKAKIAGSSVNKALSIPAFHQLRAKWQKKDYIPPVGSVNFGSLRRVTPISRVWGTDRGRPVDRYYISRFLALHANAIHGRVLEIGNNGYTREFGREKVTQSDVLNVSENVPGTTIVADLAAAPHVPSDSFDCVICTQTLQLVYEVKSAVQTLHRILKPGGILLATLPGISQTYDEEWGAHWYWNFTGLSARRLFEDIFPATHVQVEEHGNVLAAVSFLHGLAAEELRKEELDYRQAGYEVSITVRAIKPLTK